MKKVVTLILVASMILLALCSCGSSQQKEQSPDHMLDGADNESFAGNDILYDAIVGMTPEADQEAAEDKAMQDQNMSDPNASEPGSPPTSVDVAFIENKFISTEKENVSTFSADVDTASYSYFRRLVESGYSLSELIATAGTSIRTEELINYFNYNYASPADEKLFSTTVQIAPCPWNEKASLMMLGLQAKQLEYSQKNNLVFLIDVSGSMNSQDKLGLLKRTFSHLTDKLGGDDVISIVTYSGNEAVVLDGCSGAKKDKILKAINDLSAKGSTNGEAGLKKAYELAEKYYIHGGNNRIIMASDGDLNVGISSVEELKSFVEQKRDGGVFLSVLGFGTGNYKDAQMETIADCGNGVYYYIDSETEAEKVFGRDIFSTLYTIAKDVKLQLTFDKKLISSYRLVGYENRLLNKEDFENDRKDAGDLGAGHSLTVCYELVLNDEAMTSDENWMKLSVRYKAPDADKSTQEDTFFSKAQYTNTPSDDFRFVCSIIKLSMLIHNSEYSKGITLNTLKENLSAVQTNDEYKLQFKELVDKLITNK